MKCRIVLLAALAVMGLATLASPAFAYNEGGSTDPAKTSCVSCHGAASTSGPHGGYTDGSSKCLTCHSVHRAPADSYALLPKATVSATCFTCHDGTGGSGVYGAIAARGLTPGGGHRFDTTNTIPIGDPATGDNATRVFSGVGGNLGCDDCHSPHGADTVAPFRGDRLRTADASTTAASSHLLRRQPTGAPYSSAAYGSDWCASCHLGAVNGGGTHNHPAETSATAGEYTYDNVPSLTGTGSSATQLAPLGGSNLGYLMPDPRSSQQQGHAPICQQCHEDSRSLGSVGNATPFAVTSPDGTGASDNPRFQGFPHETVNGKMLVETGDDLCTNCHSPAQLP